MRITFLTRRNDHQINSSLITVLHPEEYSFTDFWAKSKRYDDDSWEYHGWLVVAHDIETRGRPNRDGLLLSAFTLDGEHVLVIDNTSVDNQEIFTPEILKRCLFIAHSADFEARWGVATNFLPMRYACTMVNHKRLLAGKDGYRNDIISVLNYWLGPDSTPVWMDKDIRNEFATCEFFTEDHILYNAADTIRLKDLYYKQLAYAESVGQSFMVKCLNSRLIIPIAKAEQLGIRHDTEKWLAIAKEREIKAIGICQELTQSLVTSYGISLELVNSALKKERESREKRLKKSLEREQKLRNTIKSLEEKGKTHLKSYTVSLQALSKLNDQLTNFPDGTQVDSSGSINWGSSKQVLEAFRQIGCPVPEAKDKKKRGEMKQGVGKEARANWFVNNEGSPFMEFMKEFDSYKKIQHNIKSFGQAWVDQYVRNGRAYTSLDQAGTGTGRFSSGSKGVKKKEYYNVQQIPVRGDDKVYRECFIADEGRSIVTEDYVNCEGVCMASLSGDLNVQKLVQMKDSHSYLGTKCWRAIYKARYLHTGNAQDGFLAENYEMNKSTPEKEKERDIFKNSGGLFPTVYGVAAAKVAATSKIPVEEGQIMIDTIKKEVPDVIQYVERKTREAVNFGYVVHNERTGSRRYFTPILDRIHYGWKVDKSVQSEIEFASRNTAVQGTNSDLMKEAICMIELYVAITGADIRFFLTNHDEWAGDTNDAEAEKNREKIEQLMIRAANNYLIPGMTMKADARVAKYWKK